MEKKTTSNNDLADILVETGRLLQAQGANPYRAEAYSKAGEAIRSLPRPAAEIVREFGSEALKSVPGIGEGLAESIDRIIRIGHLPLLERLRGMGEPETLFATIGGIGPKLARRVTDELGIKTLPELERALSTGQLQKVPGFGEKRVQMVRESLFGRLRKTAEPRTLDLSANVPNEPPVEVILDVDREYRERARKRDLPHIAPRRFNPTHEAWLPILHTERRGQGFSALYSNTARAHEKGLTRDWVVVYRDERHGDGQWTVITSQWGKLRGRRIVRGREEECKAAYMRQRSSNTARPHSQSGARRQPRP